MQKLTKAVGEPITPRQLTEQMARLNATFGTPKDRTPEQARIMANEWFKALRGFGERTVVGAITKAIQACKWWPSLAEIAEHCRNDDESWREAIGVKGETGGPKRFTEKQEPDLTPDEISRRAAVIAEAKRKYGWSPAFDAWDECNKPQKADNGPFVVEVSDVSDELRAVLKKQKGRSQ